MNKEVENFPIGTVRELSLSSDEVNQIKEEIPSNKEFNDQQALINKHIQHQPITKATFQKKLRLDTLFQTTFLIQTNSISPK